MKKIYYFLVLTQVWAETSVSDYAKNDVYDHFVVYSDLDYLLWFVNEDGLSYTTVAKTENSTSSNFSYQERDQFLNPGWRSGFRGKLGIQPKHIGWDTNFSYIYYYSSTNESIDTSASTLSSPNTYGTSILSDAAFQLFEEFPGPLTSYAKGDWNFHFNRIDWEFGRKLALASDFLMRPLIGLEGVWIGQTVSESVQTTFTELNEGLPSTNLIEIKNKGRFLGIGSKVGLDTVFHLGAGFSFYGSAMGNILWGRFQIDQILAQTDVFLNATEVDLGSESIDHSHFASIFNWDLDLGFSWKHIFPKRGRSITLKFGWEQHFYSNMDRFQNFYVEDIVGKSALFAFDRNLQKGNLSLSGFSFGVLLTF